MGKSKKPRCPRCGKRDCLCGIMEENMGKMKISTVPAKYERTQTTITKINPNQNEALKKFSKAFGTGGFIEGKTIVLRGDQRQNLGNVAAKLGYPRDLIREMFASPPPLFLFSNSNIYTLILII